MVQRNPHIAKLQANYLFTEIAAKKEAFLNKHPNADLISLGIGDTTEPIPEKITSAFIDQAKKLSKKETYTGYEPPFGREELRKLIAMKVYQNRILPEDIFVSDGSKCDIGRLQLLFSDKCQVAVQDPSYPAYVGATLLSGKSNGAIHYLPCTPTNNFCPSIKESQTVDLLYLCSPNNPTGSLFTKEQLESYVSYAKKEKIFIIYDTAYAAFIQDENIPKSIFEIPGAEEVAIETASFSKLFGFTGIRLGWTVVSSALTYQEGGSVREDWMKIITNTFNAASNLAQAGGIAALSEEGLKAGEELVHYYLKNACLLKKSVENSGFTVYGGDHAPYLWIDLKGKSSWEMFDYLLHEAHLITTPGVGFGPSGEGFLRMSAFGNQERIQEAAKRIERSFCRLSR